MIFTSSEGGVRTLVLTPRTTFETWFSAQKRGARPWLAPVLIAGENLLNPEAAKSVKYWYDRHEVAMLWIMKK